MLAAVIYLAAFALLIIFLWKHRRADNATQTASFFHPFCNAGGGGERVLWTAVAALQKARPNLNIVVYTGDDAQDILSQVKTRFGIELLRPIQFVRLSLRFLVEERLYPRLTMAMQALGSFVLAIEAVLCCWPDVVIDTMGYAFAYPVFRLFGCPIVAYVHYPIISLDMIERVESGTATCNNAGWIAQCRLATNIKIIYYKIFALLYAVCGYFATAVMVNSSWTLQHIRQVWKREDALLVYPPCDLSAFLKSPIDRQREDLVVSLGQFRPEKNHHLQLEILKSLYDLEPKYVGRVKLAIIGGCRNDADKNRVAQLKSTAVKLGIEAHVEFHVEATHEIVCELLGRASIGLHTMIDEHFGINIVEFMAAGLIPVANNSGGPRLDIVDQKGRLGFLCSTAEEYAKVFDQIMSMTTEEQRSFRQRARHEALSKFDQTSFEHNFLQATLPILHLE